MKSHVIFTKSERRGIFILLIIIIGIQTLYWLLSYNTNSELTSINKEELQHHQNHIDSLRQIALKANRPKIYPFNPNYITDYKGYTLSMSVEEINRLHTYRKQNKWVNSTQEFQNVTQVSDSLLNTFSNQFKFPDWVTNSKSKTLYSKPKELSYSQKKDLNSATAIELQNVYGIGPYYSEKIIAHRESLNGFTDNIQLKDIYGLKPDAFQNILKQFTVKTPRIIEKINVNTAKVIDLSELPNLDYEIARQIIKYRDSIQGFISLGQLKIIDEFPVEKLDRIKLYLTLQ